MSNITQKKDFMKMKDEASDKKNAASNKSTPDYDGDAENGESPEQINQTEPPARQPEDEPKRTKTQPPATIEQNEIQTDELKAANKELHAMIEERQSVNEDLTIVNQELKIKIEELSVLTFIDITNRKEDEARLKESEENLRLLVESATDYAIFTVTPENLVKTWNKGAERIFGYTEKEILGQSGEILFTPEDRAQGAAEQELKTALEKGRAEDERRHLRKDGSQFFASGIMQPLSNRSAGFVKIARDMTAKIQAAQVQRDKETLQKLVGAQEEERRRIARDLHDELGQQLTALRLKLESVRKACKDEDLCAQIDEAQAVAARIDNGVDFLSWELRPAALDDLGLLPAIEKYVREWSQYTAIEAEVLETSLKKARFLPEVETNLYRIVQEAFNNVHKHAAANRVELQLEKRDDSIVLVIEDDGCGFDTEKLLNRSTGIGLIGIKERTVLMGGSFEIESVRGVGTTLYVRVPLSVMKKRGSK